MKSLFPPLEHYGDRLAPLESPTTISGGFSGAVVGKLATRGRTYAVRGWPPETDLRRLRALHRLLTHVAAEGIPVAVPLTDLRGSTLFRHEERWWQVEPWLSGRADFHDSPTDGKLAAAMRMLAAFHRAAATFSAADEDAEWFEGPAFGPAPAVQDRAALLLRRVLDGERNMLDAAMPATPDDEFDLLARRALREFDRVGETVFAQVRHAKSISVPLGPCLRDVWHDHVLFTGDDVSGLIDPAACRRDTVAADLARLLGSLLRDDTPRWETAIAAYARHRPLTIDEIALIPILDRSGLLLSAATWLRRRYLFRVPCGTPAVLARLGEIVGRLERIA